MEFTIEEALKTAIEAHTVGETERADQLYTAILKAQPKHPDANHNMGVLAVSIGKVELALPFFKKALESNPNIEQFWISYIGALIKLGWMVEAELVFEQAKALGIEGKAFDKLREKIILKDPLPDIVQTIIDLNSRGQTQKALGKANELLNDFPSSAVLHNIIGGIYTGLSEFDLALESYKKAIDIQPEFAEALQNLGSIQKEKGDFPAALESFKKATNAKPDFAKAHFNMATTLQAMGNLPEAVHCYNEAIKLEKNFGEAISNLANLYLELEQYENAKNNFDRLGNRLSVAKSLECLYYLGKYKTFNETLKKIATTDTKNRRVAAISAFASHQLKQDDIYPFCPNPLDFIKTNQIKTLIPNSNQFIQNLLIEMDDHRLIWEQRTTKGGYQTDGNDNIFVNPGKNILLLKKLIEQEAKAFHKKFNSSNSILIKNWPEHYIIKGWYNKLLKNGYQESHIHPAGWISGVIYLKTIKNPVRNEGAIEFSLHGFKYPIANKDYPSKIYQPNNGDILLFPSSLFHKTVPVLKEVERCVIAFDLLPKD